MPQRAANSSTIGGGSSRGRWRASPRSKLYSRVAAALLLLGDRHVEVEVELTAERRGPGEGPAQALLVRLQLGQRRARHGHQRHVVIREVHGEAVEAVGDRRAGRASRLVVGAEHEVIDQELRAAPEQVLERRGALRRCRTVVLVDAHPGQRLAQLGQLVAAVGQVLLRLRAARAVRCATRRGFRSDAVVMMFLRVCRG